MQCLFRLPVSVRLNQTFFYINQQIMKEDITVVFRGFLNLPNLEKLKLVEAINEYFDSNEREPIRSANEDRFEDLDFDSSAFVCKCCGR